MNKEKLFKYCFGCSPDGFPEGVIATPFVPLGIFEKYHEASGRFKGRMYSGIRVSPDKRKDFAVVHCGIGDRLMGDAVLLMGEAGVRRMIFTGTCGGFAPREIGDIVICENAFDGEGFTRYYKPGHSMDGLLERGEMVPADREWTRTIKDGLSGRGTVECGDVLTIGSLLAEGRKGDLVTLADKGFTGVEMELSAVYSASKAAGISAAGFAVVSDLPLEKPIGEELAAEEKVSLRIGIENMVRFAVDAISK